MSVRKFSTASILSPSYKNSKIWDGETFPGYFESIATATSTYGAVFTNVDTLPYTHLQIRVMPRDTAATSVTDFCIRFNSDSGSTSYRWHRIIGNGSFSQSDSFNTSFMGCSLIPGSSVTSGIYGVAIIDILDYKSTNKVKVVRTLGGFDANGSGFVGLNSGMWVGSASTQVTQIEVFTGTGQAVANNHFALYGIRTA